MTFELPAQAHIAFTLALTVSMMVLLVLEKIPQTMTALLVVTALVVWFGIFPFSDPAGQNLLDARALLAGFGNPSLIAVLSLLVMGQAMAQSGALDFLDRSIGAMKLPAPWMVIAVTLLLTAALSAILNNTPIVVMFIPLFETLARRLQRSPSRILLPLSYAAILGGTTTLIGSSTNLLVSTALTNMGERPLGFFSMTPLALIMAAVGLVYVIFVLPKILPARASLAGQLTEDQPAYLAELTVLPGSELDGVKPIGRRLPGLPDANLQLVHRQGMTVLPPFDDFTIQDGDLLILNAPSNTLTDALAGSAVAHLDDLHLPEAAPVNNPAGDGDDGDEPAPRHQLAEVMIAPASRMPDSTFSDMTVVGRRWL